MRVQRNQCDLRVGNGLGVLRALAPPLHQLIHIFHAFFDRLLGYFLQIGIE